MSSRFDYFFRRGRTPAHAGLVRPQALYDRAARDTALRTRISSLLYVVIFSIVIGFSPFYNEHPGPMLLIGTILAVGTLLRALCVWGFDWLYPNHARGWWLASSSGVLIQAAGWGVLCIFSIHYYGWQWPTMIICLSAAAFSAGAVVTLSPIYFLVVAFLMLILVPTVAFSLLVGTQQSLIAALLFGTYIAFLVLVAGRLNHEYWDAKINNYLLDHRARQLEMKNEELESFAYSVSHDLRSPLRAIDGYSQFLVDDAVDRLTETEQSYLLRIRQAAQRMDRLIDDLLELSRVSKQTYQPREVDLSEMVQRNFAKLRERDPDRTVVLDVEPEVRAVADPFLMKIALQNLTDNAWKYSRGLERPRIRFGTRREDADTVYYLKNDGAGFDPRYRDKLFKPFQRLHEETAYPGTGIGLATVQRVIERHNGQIWANGKPHKGATFYFTLGVAESLAGAN